MNNYLMKMNNYLMNYYWQQDNVNSVRNSFANNLVEA